MIPWRWAAMFRAPRREVRAVREARGLHAEGVERVLDLLADQKHLLVPEKEKEIAVRLCGRGMESWVTGFRARGRRFE